MTQQPMPGGPDQPAASQQPQGPGGIAERAALIAAAYAGQEGALLPILHAVQAIFGFIPDEAVPAIAEAQNLSRAEVHGTISFYPDLRRRPAGRHVLRLCRAEACQARGANRLAAHARAALGVGWHETTEDGAVTLEPVFCLGLCAAAPCGEFDGRSVARLSEGQIDIFLHDAT